MRVLCSNPLCSVKFSEGAGVAGTDEPDTEFCSEACRDQYEKVELDDKPQPAAVPKE